MPQPMPNTHAEPSLKPNHAHQHHTIQITIFNTQSATFKNPPHTASESTTSPHTSLIVRFWIETIFPVYNATFRCPAACSSHCNAMLPPTASHTTSVIAPALQHGNPSGWGFSCTDQARACAAGNFSRKLARKCSMDGTLKTVQIRFSKFK